jgi:isoquinoline 1-oxidoreductase beta subunit
VSSRVSIDRRAFLKQSIGGALLIGLSLPSRARTEPESADRPAAVVMPPEPPAHFAPNAWVRIEPTGAIAFVVARSEMGQGVMTALPMLIAEELGVGLDQITVRFAPAAPEYINRLVGQQLTGGSTSVRDAWTKLREAGAVARTLLMDAAAARWGVAAEDCQVARGEVIHPGGTERLGFGELAEAASQLPLPTGVFLTDPQDWTLIGTPAPRLDAPDKVNGRARFGIDVRLTDMVVASIERCPVFGGSLRGFDPARAKALPGVLDVREVSVGVAVVARDTATALRGRGLLRIDWDLGPNAELSSASLREAFERRLAEPGVSVRREGDPEAAWSGAVRTLEAIYDVPFQAHACMEPMNCTATCARTAATSTSRPRRRHAASAPAWTSPAWRNRRYGCTRPSSAAASVAAASRTSCAMPSSCPNRWPGRCRWSGRARTTSATTSTVRRGSTGCAAASTAMACRYSGHTRSSRRRSSPASGPRLCVTAWTRAPSNSPQPCPTPSLTSPSTTAWSRRPCPWASGAPSASSQNAWITECFLDELAAAGGQDPLALRRRLLKDRPRHLGVLISPPSRPAGPSRRRPASPRHRRRRVLRQLRGAGRGGAHR